MAIDFLQILELIVTLANDLATQAKEFIFGMFPGQELLVSAAIAIIIGWGISRSRLSDFLIGVVVAIFIFLYLQK